ncbi:MAG: hypothetical protein P8L81_04030 [Hellea sp.]|nr:hypothetical protein [Hellea sp.]|tara:strand:+ start:209 stop:1357 length:1149 start_codon:yes stop_codon:yes gene_type:complete
MIRSTVLNSLSAIGATKEAKFYADLFAAQDAEKFALIVIDPRCLKNPLLESFISNLKILSDLKLSPVLLVGALDDSRTSIKFQSQRLANDLEHASVRTAKLNTASYQLLPEVRQKARRGKITILEMTDPQGKMNLKRLVTELGPNKVIFLQPSGGLSIGGKRLSFVNVDSLDKKIDSSEISSGQRQFIDLVKYLAGDKLNEAVYIIASPLNLLAELFTTKGSGTMIRRGIKIKKTSNLASLNKSKLKVSIEEAFNKQINPDFFDKKILKAYLEDDYRGGAIFTVLSGYPYLSKFWVTNAARGEGIARDIWEEICVDTESFFWRSRMNNPFNDWYMKACDGMQVIDNMRVFWKGLYAVEVREAITAAAKAPEDFKETHEYQIR